MGLLEKFNGLSTTGKAVVVGGTVVLVAGTSYLGYKAVKRYRTSKKLKKAEESKSQTTKEKEVVADAVKTTEDAIKTAVNEVKKAQGKTPAATKVRQEILDLLDKSLDQDEKGFKKSIEIAKDKLDKLQSVEHPVAS